MARTADLSLNVALTNSVIASPDTIGSRAMAKSTKSPVKPFLVLVASSVVTWAAFMAIHALK
jgi:hypothetical protein